VVSLPVDGTVAVTATDQSGTPLLPGIGVVVFGEPAPPCTVTVNPASVLFGGTVQLSASSECDGVVQFAADPAYTWAISTQGCTGSSVSEDGLYTAPASGSDCTDEVQATDTANGDAVGTGTVNVTSTEPSVSISPTSTTLEPGDTATFTASTNNQIATPVYSWTVSGGTLDTTSGDSVVFTAGSAGSASVTVTDTANNDESATASITIEDIITEMIEVSPDPMLRSRWVFLPGVITIQGTGTDFGLLSRVTAEPNFSVTVVPLTKLVLGPEFIMQAVVVWPNWLAGSPGDGQVVTFTVDGLSDDVTVNLLPFILDE
jgi:plastocyanin